MALSFSQDQASACSNSKQVQSSSSYRSLIPLKTSKYFNKAVRTAVKQVNYSNKVATKKLPIKVNYVKESSAPRTDYMLLDYSAYDMAAFPAKLATKFNLKNLDFKFFLQVTCFQTSTNPLNFAVCHTISSYQWFNSV